MCEKPNTNVKKNTSTAKVANFRNTHKNIAFFFSLSVFFLVVSFCCVLFMDEDTYAFVDFVFVVAIVLVAIHLYF